MTAYTIVQKFFQNVKKSIPQGFLKFKIFLYPAAGAKPLFLRIWVLNIAEPLPVTCLKREVMSANFQSLSLNYFYLNKLRVL